MPHSDTFRLVHRAILDRKQVTCVYKNLPREFCPVILGHKDDAERLLVYQFGGASDGRLPDWRCFRVAGMSDVKLRDGPWLAESEHRAAQTCVEDVYIDVNTDVPNQPGRPAAP